MSFADPKVRNRDIIKRVNDGGAVAVTDLGFVVTSDLLAQEVHALIKEPVVKLQSTWRGTRVRLALYLWSRASRDVLPPETCQPGKVASSSGEERGKGQKLPTVDSFSSAPISSGGSKSTESRNGDLVVVGTSPSLELCPLVRTQLDLVRCASSESKQATPVASPSQAAPAATRVANTGSNDFDLTPKPLSASPQCLCSFLVPRLSSSRCS